MSLTTDDLNEIRNIIESALTRQSSEIIEPIKNELQALGDDVKEVYSMIARIQKSPDATSLQKLNLEEKILKTPFRASRGSGSGGYYLA